MQDIKELFIVKYFAVSDFENVQVTNSYLESTMTSYILTISHLMQIDVAKLCESQKRKWFYNCDCGACIRRILLIYLQSSTSRTYLKILFQYKKTCSIILASKYCRSPNKILTLQVSDADESSIHNKVSHDNSYSWQKWLLFQQFNQGFIYSCERLRKTVNIKLSNWTFTYILLLGSDFFAAGLSLQGETTTLFNASGKVAQLFKTHLRWHYKCGRNCDFVFV